MENNISVSLRDWEEKVRDQRSLEILSGLLNVDGYISVDHVRVILGLQVDKIPDVQPTEPAIWIDELVDPEDLPEVSESEAPIHTLRYNGSDQKGGDKMDNTKACIERIKERIEELKQKREKWEKIHAINFAMGWFRKDKAVPYEVLEFIMDCKDLIH